MNDLIKHAEKQEPFGYFRYDIRLDAWVQIRNSNQGVAFYTHPQPKREWVGLTDKEIKKFWRDATVKPCYTSELIDNFARAIEAKLKEKNT